MGKRGCKPGQGKKAGGRQKGTPNKKTQGLLELADRLGVNPIHILLSVAGGLWQELGYKTGFKTVMTDRGPMKVPLITLPMRVDAASRVSDYLYPRRKPVDDAGESEDQFNFNVNVNWADEDSEPQHASKDSPSKKD